MFEQEWLERLSCVNPAWLPFVFAPPAAWLVWNSVGQGLSVFVIGLLVLGGFVSWTLTEYVVHRFVFHFQPHGQASLAIAYLLHGVHHAFPDDDRRWVIPLTVSIPVAVGLGALSRLILGPLYGPFFAGFMAGYLCYDLTHWAAHRGGTKSRVGRFLRAYHLQHHYARPDRHFGISSPLWDHLFRTADGDARDR